MFEKKWTPEQKERLKELWPTGITTAKIGELMGFNKNQIIGAAHRLKLPKRASPIGNGRPDGALNLHRKPPRQRAPKPIGRGMARGGAAAVSQAMLAASASHARGAPMLDQPKRQEPAVKPPVYYKACRWPLWRDRAEPTHQYCDAPTELGAYCAHHAAICYEPRKQKGAQPNV